MNFPSALMGYLLSDEQIAKLLLHSDGTYRLYPQRVPQFAAEKDLRMPAVRYQQISAVSVLDISGAVGLRDLDLQIDSYAYSYDLSREIDELIRLRLCSTGSVMLGDVWIDSILLGSRFELYESPIDGSDRGYYRASSSYDVFHDEVPTGRAI